MLAGYKTGKSEKISQSLLAYIEVVKTSVDTFLAPSGSYKDFIVVANNASNEYKQAQKKLKRVLPKKSKLDNFSELVKVVLDYPLFKDAATQQLLGKKSFSSGCLKGQNS